MEICLNLDLYIRCDTHLIDIRLSFLVEYSVMSIQTSACMENGCGAFEVVVSVLQCCASRFILGIDHGFC